MQEAGPYNFLRTLLIIVLVYYTLCYGYYVCIDRFFYNLAYATNLNWYEMRCGEVGAISSGSHRFNNFHVDMNLLEETINRISTAQ